MLNNIRKFYCGGILKEYNKIKIVKNNLKKLNTFFKDNQDLCKYTLYPKKFYIGHNYKEFVISQNEIHNKNSINNYPFITASSNSCNILYSKNKWFMLHTNFHFIAKKVEHASQDSCCNGKPSSLNGKEEEKKLNEQDNENDFPKSNNINSKSRKYGCAPLEEVRKDTECTRKNNYLQNKHDNLQDSYLGSSKSKVLKGNYLKNVHSLLITKKIKETLTNLKSKHSYKIVVKRIQMEKKKINAILTKYQIKRTENVMYSSDEHTYRKAIINTKKKIFTLLKRNNNKSFMDIYYEEKTKYKLRKEKLFQSQEKLIKNSKIAHTSIKNFFKKYGYVGLGTYFVVFLVTFCCSYLFVHFKYISLADLKYLSEKMHLNKYIDDDLHKKIDSLWGELIFAYIASKITEPVRIVITVIITPYIAKVIRFKKGSRIKSH
ncbi:conserved Plasmodium protein, unknown function [Plasmodium ovale]|nr:conserved Plasmodium protein, unknown function [Plasmodium ovale]